MYAIKSSAMEFNGRFRSALLLLFVVLAVAGRAEGNELYRAVVLPDVGFGGEANAAVIFLDHDGDTEVVSVAGEINLGDGRNVPATWQYDYRDRVTLHQLPIPAGASGTANGIITGAGPGGGPHVIAGTVTPFDEPSRAVVWVGTVADGFTEIPLPDHANGSRANGIIAVLIGLAVGGEMTMPDGHLVPVVWAVDLDTGEITRERLPIPPGTEGTASAIILDPMEAGLVAAGTVNRNGRTRAAQWTNDGDGWKGELLGTPRGADSMAFGSWHPNASNFVSSAGAVCFDGLCSATMWGPDGNAQLLPAVQKFRQSIANSLYRGNGALAVVGEAFDEQGSVGAMFLPEAELAVDVNKLLVDQDAISITQVNAICWFDAIMVGTGVIEGEPPINRGVLFIPVDGLHVPQQMNVPVGAVTNGDVTSTWQEDNDKLRLRPRGFPGEPMIVTTFESQAIGEVGELEDLLLTFCVNGRSKDQDSKFEVQVLALNYTDVKWTVVKTVQVTTTEAEFSVTPPGDPNDYINSDDLWLVRLQIRRTAGRGRWDFEINSCQTEIPR